MNQSIAIVLILISSLLCLKINAQKNKIYCTKGCDSLDIELVKYGLSLKTRKDSIRSYHLAADIAYSYHNDFAKSISLLRKVHKMDSMYISKNFSFYLEFKKRHPKINYFVSELPKELLETFLDKDYLEENRGSTSKMNVVGIFNDLQEKDQKFRGKITRQNIKLDCDSLGVFRRDSIKTIINELWSEQNKQDSINIELLKSINPTEYSLLFEDVGHKEMSVLFTVFLHAGKSLSDITKLLDYLYLSKKLSYDSYLMIIGRSYVDYLGRSPIRSIYGETDEKLIPLFKEQYPLIFEEIMKRKN